MIRIENVSFINFWLRRQRFVGRIHNYSLFLNAEKHKGVIIG